MAHSKRPDFFASEEAKYIRKQLKQMEDDDQYDTRSTYHANATLYPKHRISFSEKHMQYLLNHPQVDCIYYISNLRLQSRIRTNL